MSAVSIELLTCRETAKLLKITERTLYSLTERGELPAVYIGRVKRYDVQDVLQMIQRAKGVTRG